MAEFSYHESPARSAAALPVMLPGKLVGRDAFLAQVYSQLRANQAVLLYGTAGVGKSALAATLASAYTELPGGALWFGVHESPLDELVVRVGRAYQVTEITSASSPLGMVGAAANTLTSHKPLLVLDGKPDAAATADFVTRVAAGLPVLITSKDPLDGPWTKMELGNLEADAAIALLKQAGDFDDSVHDDLDELASILDYNPYAIMLAAGTMKASKQPPAVYLKAFEQIPSSAGATPQLLALTIAFRSLNKALQGLVLMLGATFNTDISTEMLSSVAGAPPETVDQVMTMLVAGGLAARTQRYDARSYYVHEITAGFAQSWLKAQNQLDALQTKVRDALLAYVRKYSVDSPAARDKLAAEMDMVMAVARWSAANGDRDSVNQFIVSLMQAGDFVNERGYVSELVKLRGLASSFTTAFPAYPPPPAAVPEPETFDEDDGFDDDDLDDELPDDDDLVDEDELDEDEEAPVASSLLDLDSDEDEEEEEEDSTAAPAVTSTGDALTDLQAALRLAKQNDSLEKQADLLDKVGALQAERKLNNEAILTYSEALSTYEELDDVEGLLKTLDTLSALMVKTENPNAAVMHATRGLGLADEMGDLESRMFLLVTLADARQQLGESGEAVRTYGQALEIARNEGDSQNEALVLHKLGYAQLDNGQPEVAADTWEQALKLFRSQGKREYEGRVLGALGTAYGELDRWEEAINFHTSALYIAREVKDKEAEALELSNLGYACVQANQLGQAVLRYRQALHLSYEANNRENIVSNIVDLARLLSQSKRHLNIADLLVNDALPLDPTDRDILKLKETITGGKMQAIAEDVALLPVNGSARDYAANAYALLDG
ncbi:MAG: tetratricopeptide repeat protein [Anaerolineae bacterium]|nr:tetratricopeptide repeat protein [Anaerolineae bacterium]